MIARSLDAASPSVTWHRPALAAFASVVLAAAPLVAGAVGLAVIAHGVPGYDGPSATALVAALLALRTLAAFTVSAQFHRSYSHAHFRFHPVVDKALRVFNFTFSGSGRVWAVMHRLHHAASDTDDDPHSPHRSGESLFTIFAQTTRSYVGVARALRRGEHARYDVGLPDDAFERFAIWVSSQGIAMLALSRVPLCVALLSLVMGWPAALCFFAALSSSFWTGSILVVNGITHLWGYRTSASGDRSTNVLPVDFVGLGELLHHNHHAFPGRSNYALLPWEVDPSFHIAVALEKVGVVRDLNRAGNTR